VAPSPKTPTAQGIGGGDDNDDCEFYGNIIFRNGWTNLDHGFYTQVTAVHTTKRWVDNVSTHQVIILGSIKHRNGLDQSSAGMLFKLKGCL